MIGMLARVLAGGLVAGGLVAGSPARAALLDPGAFAPTATIGFGTAADIGTSNPVYTLGGVTVSFAGYFVGQTLDGDFPSAPVNPGVAGTPLALAGAARILGDLEFPGSPVLAGDTNGDTQYSPIAFLFSSPVAALSLLAGYLDEPNGVTVTAFATDGTNLGSVTSAGIGLQFFRLAHEGGRTIAGVLVFPTVGVFEPAFSIDNLAFVTPGVAVTAPGGMALLLPLAAMLWARRRAG